MHRNMQQITTLYAHSKSVQYPLQDFTYTESMGTSFADYGMACVVGAYRGHRCSVCPRTTGHAQLGTCASSQPLQC